MRDSPSLTVTVLIHLPLQLQQALLPHIRRGNHQEITGPQSCWHGERYLVR